MSPIVKAREEETALGAGLIALVGTIFAVGYTIIRPFLGITDIQYGVWSGVSLHEIAHVALAAAPAGQDALAIGLLAKLGRVFLLIPLSFMLMVWMRRKGKSGQSANNQEGGKIISVVFSRLCHHEFIGQLCSQSCDNAASWCNGWGIEHNNLYTDHGDGRTWTECEHAEFADVHG